MVVGGVVLHYVSDETVQGSVLVGIGRPGCEGFFPFRKQSVGQRKQKVVLGFEIIIQSAFRDSRRIRNIGKGQGLRFGNQQFFRTFEDFFLDIVVSFRRHT